MDGETTLEKGRGRPADEAGPMRRWAQRVLAPADVRLDGERDWDVQVHDERLFRRVWLRGSLGLGEAYMDGWWDCPRLDQLFTRVMAANVDSSVRFTPPELLGLLRGALGNPQARRRAFRIGEHHYDIGNDLYEAMLDRRLTYSCGYWKEAEDVDGAQEAKLELICQKLHLKPGQRLLDIGCGWGSLVQYAAEKHGVEAVGVTVSREQAAYVREKCKDLPVEVRLADYRSLDGSERFDAVASVGMFEHVGHRNHRRFMDVARRAVKDDGLLLLHTIGRPTSTVATDPWIARYIFPNSMLPSAKQITSAAEADWVLEDWHNFGADYDRTLMAWHANVEAAWPTLPDRYDERFRRMWRYYLLSSAGGFRSRRLQLWQVVLAPGRGVPGGYVPVR